MKKRIFTIAFAITLILSNASAQVTNVSQDTLAKNNINPLKDLKKTGPGDIDRSKPMMLNPSTTPMYYENFALIKEDEFMKIMMSGDYVPEPYIDSNKVIKAFVFRKATELEKKQMRGNTQNPSQNKNELIGKEAFPFSVTDISGNKYSLEKLKGKVIVINFWFVECKPCVMEIPELNNLVDKYGDKGVVFLGFATNEKLKIESFLKRKPFKYNIIADSRDNAVKYKVYSYPTHIIIDKSSKISYYSSGLGPTTIENLEKKIESLIK